VVVARRVAVAGWQWCHSKEEISTVRMVSVREWQWQYWPGYGCGLICANTIKSKWQWQCQNGVVVARRVAVAGWQWDRSKEEIKTVRVVSVRVWQCQYWPILATATHRHPAPRTPPPRPRRPGPPATGPARAAASRGRRSCFGGRRWHGEWQWLGGSGTNRRSGSRRFEWYRLERGSGSIEGDISSGSGSGKM
jgi:hypothetical protein